MHCKDFHNFVSKLLVNAFIKHRNIVSLPKITKNKDSLSHDKNLSYFPGLFFILTYILLIKTLSLHFKNTKRP